MKIRTSRLVAAVALCLSLPTGTAAATGSAVCRMTTERRIPEIVVQVIAGAVSDVV